MWPHQWAAVPGLQSSASGDVSRTVVCASQLRWRWPVVHGLLRLPSRPCGRPLTARDAPPVYFGDVMSVRCECVGVLVSCTCVCVGNVVFFFSMAGPLNCFKTRAAHEIAGRQFVPKRTHIVQGCAFVFETQDTTLRGVPDKHYHLRTTPPPPRARPTQTAHANAVKKGHQPGSTTEHHTQQTKTLQPGHSVMTVFHPLGGWCFAQRS